MRRTFHEWSHDRTRFEFDSMDVTNALAHSLSLMFS